MAIGAGRQDGCSVRGSKLEDPYSGLIRNVCPVWTKSTKKSPRRPSNETSRVRCSPQSNHIVFSSKKKRFFKMFSLVIFRYFVLFRHPVLFPPVKRKDTFSFRRASGYRTHIFSPKIGTQNNQTEKELFLGLYGRKYEYHSFLTVRTIIDLWKIRLGRKADMAMEMDHFLFLANCLTCPSVFEKHGAKL